MKVSTRGLAEIAGHEGIVLSRYKDSVGIWTVYVGHTASAGPPDPAKMAGKGTIADAMALFAKDIAKFEDRVSRAVKVPLAQHEFDALVSFDFNTGGIFKAQLTKHLNAGDRKAAGEAFMGWLKPPEILSRRTAEMKLFLTGQYGDGMATVYEADEAGNVLWSRGRRMNVLDTMKTAPAPVIPPSPKPGLLARLLAALKRLFLKG